jgi:sugar O-acyltransferase (sialic acid O-acetyltransferase NeuD family)
VSKKQIAIIGAGGFAREVAWLIRDISRVSGEYEFAGFVVTDPSRLSDRDSRDLVRGDYDWLVRNAGRSVDALAIGIGDPAARLRVAQELQALVPALEWPALVHPTAHFDRALATLGEGVLLCAGVIGTVNIRLEPFSMCNLACTIGHEARIGRGSVLNPTVNVSGGVDMGEGVLVGTGVQILQYVKIGDRARIGAGAVVVKDVAPGQTVVGVPARPMLK